SVVTHTDTLLVTVPPEVRPDTAAAVPTAPVEVTVYAEPRPDTSRAFDLYGWHLTPDTLVLHGTAASFAFRVPVRGEAQVGTAEGPRAVRAVVTGRPAPPPPVRLECPPPPEPGVVDRLREAAPFLVLGVLAGAAVVILYGLRFGH